MIFFKSESNKRVSLNNVFELFKDYVQQKQDNDYRIIIGTDSMSRGNGIKYVTAIILLRVGNGGIIFYKGHYDKNVSLHEKIMMEVSLSIEMANEFIIPECLNRQFYYPVEIHIDVGAGGESTKFTNLAVGYVKGCGFSDEEIKVKPFAFGASNVADRYTR